MFGTVGWEQGGQFPGNALHPWAGLLKHTLEDVDSPQDPHCSVLTRFGLGSVPKIKGADDEPYNQSVFVRSEGSQNIFGYNREK